MAEKGAARQRREAWSMLRPLPSKRWQARYRGPDGNVYSARTADDRPMTFLAKTDARALLNQTHATIARGEWESPEDAVRRREAAAAALRDVTSASTRWRGWSGSSTSRVRAAGSGGPKPS